MMKKILVTGATGFLGGAVVSKLISKQKTQNNLLLLVRGESATQALYRVKENLINFALSQELLESLTEDNILLGDLAEPEDFLNHPLLDTVTHVLNCAAVASFGNNPLIWKVNVEGTFKFAQRMSKVPAIERFVHVGTAMSCVPEPDSLIEEGGIYSEREQHLVNYTWSKATIEHLMVEKLPTLPLVIARPSIVVGHSELGCAPSSSIFWVFSMALALGKFLCSLEDKIDVVPVDYCAEALLLLLVKDDVCLGGIYHISAGENDSVSFDEIDKAMAKALSKEPISKGYQQVEYHEIAKMRGDFPIIFGPCNQRIMLRAINIYGSFSKMNVRFSNQKILALGLSRPPKFTSYLHLCVESTRYKTIPQLMAIDFK